MDVCSTSFLHFVNFICPQHCQKLVWDQYFGCVHVQLRQEQVSAQAPRFHAIEPISSFIAQWGRLHEQNHLLRFCPFFFFADAISSSETASSSISTARQHKVMQHLC